MQFSKILEPGSIGTMNLKNRLIVPAMSTRFCGSDGKATDQFIAFHTERAKGSWALIIAENYLIAEGVGVKLELPGLWSDDQIPSHKRLTDSVHSHGGKICAQIYHAGRNTHSGITGVHNVAPSPICDPSNREIPHELTKEEIEVIEDQFAQAALRAKKAGFDAVEVHGAHGYLVAQFLSPFSNRRSDCYGGTLENRTRFAVEIVQKIKETAGSDYPVIFRISADEYIEQGINIHQAKAICMLLEAAGVDAINSSQSGPATFYNTVPSFYVQNGAFVHQAAEIKKTVHIPVIAVGRINSPTLAEEVLASGKSDFVAMGRAAVADPFLPAKTIDGRIEDIQTCIACCQGCLGNTIRKKTVTCFVNPFAGKETDYHIGEQTTNPKNVAVVGGGISGLEASYILALRGHKVTLYEASGKTGGQWNAASVPQCKGEFTSFVSWLNLQLSRLDVTVCLNTRPTARMLKEASYEVVFDATGSHPIDLHMTDQAPVFTTDILTGKVPFGKHPLIIGGGLAGAETAEFIASYNVPVTLVEMRDAIAADCEPGPRYFLMASLKKLNVKTYTCAKIKEIRGDQVLLEKEDGITELNGIDQIIYAVGVAPNKELGTELEGNDLTVIRIGDAAGAKNGFANVQEAFEKAWAL